MKTFEFTPAYEGERISDMLLRHGVDFDMPCAGNHQCGKCRVRVNGDVSPVSSAEEKLLQRQNAPHDRLACFAQAYGPVTVAISDEGRQQILGSDGIISADAPLMAKGCYGVAIDIGTTTVVCSLYDANGAQIGSECGLNQQRCFGADVVSRISYGMEHGNEPVHAAIVSQLEGMIDVLCANAHISRALVTHAVAVGNTTMLHFFTGLDPAGIGVAPFTPQSLFDSVYDGLLNGVSVYIPPCISGYVGADLVSCIVTSQMLKKSQTALIVDIGTNGEMALLHNGVLHCCSTAAGPAFEGAGMSHGSVAKAGAITHVAYDAATGAIQTEVIGNARPESICGSGIVDAVSMLVSLETIDVSGRIEPDPPQLKSCIQLEPETAFVFPDSTVQITQSDVRKLQLAKAAIHAGIMTLSAACGIRPDRIDKLYVCGGFGSFLNMSSAENILLIPGGTASKAESLGNAALQGAAIALLNGAMHKEMRDVAANANYIELSSNSGFMDQYVESMFFGEE